MSWQGIVGHDVIADRFRRSIKQGRLASTFLFVGPEGIGKRTFALKLAQALLCDGATEEELSPCGTCPACHQVESETHPDLMVIQKPAERAVIPVDLLIGDREHRMRAGLCHFMSLTPAGGKRRVAIIDDADYLNQEGANSLLKTLEEPSHRALIVLISTSALRQLPTVRSRSQIVQFQPLSSQHVASCLTQLGFAPDVADEMACRASGSVSQAIARAEDADRAFREEFWTALAAPTIHRHQLAQLVHAFADAAGKETAEKRARLRDIFEAAIDFYRTAARRTCQMESSDERALSEAVLGVAERGSLSLDTLASLVERSSDAIRQLHANANLNILVDAWICDVAEATRTGRPLFNSTFS